MPFRAFISADFGRFPRVEAFREALRNSGARLKVVDLDQLHTTLKFLGDTDEAVVPELVSAMERAAEGIPPLRVKLVGTGVFPSERRPRVVWIGLEGAKDLATIAARLDAGCEALGFRPERRAWEPHVTIARVKEGRDRRSGHPSAHPPVDAGTRTPGMRGAIETFASEEFGETVVDRIRLKRSVLRPDGPEYTTVAEAVLRA